MSVWFRISQRKLREICVGHCEDDAHVIFNDSGSTRIEYQGESIGIDNVRQMRDLAAQLLFLAEYRERDEDPFEPVPEDREHYEALKRFERGEGPPP